MPYKDIGIPYKEFFMFNLLMESPILYQSGKLTHPHTHLIDLKRKQSL